MKVVIVFKNGNSQTMENVYNVFGSKNKLEIKDITGKKYEYNYNEISGWSCNDDAI